MSVERYMIAYYSVCAFYTAVFMWLEAPQVGFLETSFEVNGVVDGVVSWFLIAAAFTYAALTVPLNVRVLHLVYQRNAHARHLVVLCTAFALIPGSIGMFFYFLIGNPYMAVAFDALTLALALYFGRCLVQLLPRGSANGSGS